MTTTITKSITDELAGYTETHRTRILIEAGAIKKGEVWIPQVWIDSWFQMPEHFVTPTNRDTAIKAALAFAHAAAKRARVNPNNEVLVTERSENFAEIVSNRLYKYE